MSDAFLQLSHLTKRFGTHVAVDDLTLSVPRGTVLALLGPSGSGKTTTLRLLAGFERPDGGTITVDGRDETRQAPAERRFGMVFQHYALFPHLTVGENVAFGLAHDPAVDKARRVSEMLALVDLEGFAERQVSALSGGQQQRVAVARALAPSPRVLLLDEPLSNLDPSLRERTRRELKAALKKIGITTIFVTHEQEEAFALGDQVAVLNEGRLEQVGAAPDLYERPATGRAKLDAGVEWAVETPQPVEPGTRVSVVVRPEALRLGEVGLTANVTGCRYTGARAYFTAEAGGTSLEFEAAVRAAHVGDAIRLAPQRALAFAEETP
jgi:putative spermidine/putrescine transport system ATP-binding protein